MHIPATTENAEDTASDVPQDATDVDRVALGVADIPGGLLLVGVADEAC